MKKVSNNLCFVTSQFLIYFIETVRYRCTDLPHSDTRLCNIDVQIYHSQWYLLNMCDVVYLTFTYSALFVKNG